MIKTISDICKEWIKLEPGAQIKIWHCKIAGSAENDRLYIKRTEDGQRIIAYCHHCGDSGSYYIPGSGDKAPSKSDYRRLVTTSGLGCTDAAALSKNESIIGDDTLILGKSFTSDRNQWHSKAIEWAEKQGLSKILIRKHNIYSRLDNSKESRANVIFTFFVGENLVLFNSRHIRKDGNKPIKKYETNKANNYKIHFPIGCFETKKPEVCFITEDVTSSIHIYEASDYMSLPLLGTHMSDSLIELLVKLKVTTVIVWLDNDNKEVKKLAHKLYCRLDTIFDKANIMLLEEAKHYTYKEISSNCTYAIGIL